MATDRVERKLAAIFATDMVAYSRLMGVDEDGTIARQKAHRAELIEGEVEYLDEYLDEPLDEPGPGHMLIGCSRPTSNLVIEV